MAVLGTTAVLGGRLCFLAVGTTAVLGTTALHGYGLGRGQAVDLIQRADDGLLAGVELLQRLVHRLGLPQDLGVGDVHDVHE